MKVLISAYACTPGAGSEPGAGWLWSRAAALAGHEVWLLTRENNQSAVEAALEREPHLAIRPVYLDLSGTMLRLKRGHRRTRSYYLLWQIAARRRVAALHAEHAFDVAHHLTFAIDWLPAGAVGVPGLPSIWGPVGGAGSIPLRLWRWLGWRGAVQEAAREAIVRPLRRGWGDTTAARAALVLAQNDDVAHRFRRHGTVWTEPNVALESGPPGEAHVVGSAQGRKAIFVGRIIPLKGLALAIAAIAHPAASAYHLQVIGDGRDRARCERMARRLGVADRIQFLGQQAREETLGHVRRADVAVFPSMHDQAGWAVGEALMLGLPVISLDLGGPATMARLDRGVAVAADGTAPQRIASALAALDGTSSEPSGRWSVDRLPQFVDSAYRFVARAASAVAEEPR